MMRADALNLHGHPLITKIADLSSHVCFADEDESKDITINKDLSQKCSRNEGK